MLKIKLADYIDKPQIVTRNRESLLTPGLLPTGPTGTILSRACADSSQARTDISPHGPALTPPHPLTLATCTTQTSPAPWPRLYPHFSTQRSRGLTPLPDSAKLHSARPHRTSLSFFFARKPTLLWRALQNSAAAARPPHTLLSLVHNLSTNPVGKPHVHPPCPLRNRIPKTLPAAGDYNGLPDPPAPIRCPPLRRFRLLDQHRPVTQRIVACPI